MAEFRHRIGGPHTSICHAAIFCFQAPALAQGPVVVRGFEVHEWGTFTFMQGSNGVGLEGLHHEEEALPHFVHSAQTISELPPLVKLESRRGVKSGISPDSAPDPARA